jgi:nitrogen regulatory protein A
MTEFKEWHDVIVICNQLRDRISSDFVGLAFQNRVGPDVRWHYVSGNLNDKFQRITVRFGKGIAGKIISTGSPMMLNDFPNEILGKATDYPIMLAEKLVSTFAVPLFFNAVPKGVLLVGKRESHIFQELEQEQVKEAALFLESVLKEHIMGDLYGKR